MTTVALIGDSVLDNFYWLTHPEQDLKYYLNKCNYRCENLAVDESQLKDVLQGMVPNRNYVQTRIYPYPINSSGKVVPLTLLEELKPEVIILSIGGNDLRVNLLNLLFGPDYFLKSVLTPAFRKNYEQLLVELKKRCKKLIVVSVYSPCVSEGIYSLVESWADPIFSAWFNFLNDLCKKYDLPILDLYRTFNNRDRSHYGSTVIEPSDSATIVMSQIFDKMIQEWNGHQIYFAPNLDINQLTRS